MNDRQIIADAKTRILSGDWYGAAKLLENSTGVEARYIAQLMNNIIAPDESTKRKVLDLLELQL